MRPTTTSQPSAKGPSRKDKSPEQRDRAPNPDRTPPGLGPDGKIDLNLASTELLESLPGIGPALAGAIVDYRQAQGPFQTVDEVVNVPRIGPVTLEKIRDLVTVSGPP